VSTQFKSKQNMAHHIDGKVCIKPTKTCHICGKKINDKRNLAYHLTNKVCQQKSKIKLELKSDIRSENLRLKEQFLKEHPQIVKTAKLST